MADIDVEIGAENAIDLRGRIRQLVQQAGPRFAVKYLRILFVPDGHQSRVPVETLPTGELGLPRRLLVIRPWGAYGPETFIGPKGRLKEKQKQK